MVDDDAVEVAKRFVYHAVQEVRVFLAIYDFKFQLFVFRNTRTLLWQLNDFFWIEKQVLQVIFPSVVNIVGLNISFKTFDIEVITNAKGTIDKSDFWGRRKLAYPIDHKTEGTYVVMNYTCEPESSAELDRQLKLNDAILRTKVLRKDVK